MKHNNLKKCSISNAANLKVKDLFITRGNPGPCPEHEYFERVPSKWEGTCIVGVDKMCHSCLDQLHKKARLTQIVYRSGSDRRP